MKRYSQAKNASTGTISSTPNGVADSNGWPPHKTRMNHGPDPESEYDKVVELLYSSKTTYPNTTW